MHLGNDHYLSVIVIVVEDGHRPSTHFYGLVKLGADQTAAAQFRLLKERFTQDNVWNSIKSKIVALVSIK